jgi:hypothetical protein
MVTSEEILKFFFDKIDDEKSILIFLQKLDNR